VQNISVPTQISSIDAGFNLVFSRVACAFSIQIMIWSMPDNKVSQSRTLNRL
jgi:hypothetical protein